MMGTRPFYFTLGTPTGKSPSILIHGHSNDVFGLIVKGQIFKIEILLNILDFKMAPTKNVRGLVAYLLDLALHVKIDLAGPQQVRRLSCFCNKKFTNLQKST